MNMKLINKIFLKVKIGEKVKSREVKEGEREKKNLNFHKRLNLKRCSTFSASDTTKMHRDKVVENSIL